MQEKLELTRIGSDDDMMELCIQVCDGTSTFSNRVYVSHQYMRNTITGLHTFKDRVHGGIYDLRFGEFGPEYASGALHARFHFHERGKLLISVTMQSSYSNFGVKNVASEATLYLMSEPALLDNFIQSLRALSDGQQQCAMLEGIDTAWSL
ncbi:hypothetical protein [Janthinobacterium violaceinigrum]|uniref:Uncharacterized protein n=1 Tax=Janthinobacterium violaceinigrum TaxID=2654252 RepID=A0A6I1HVG8_9BURK|nr:hypothetical protein [Janthinobacterium violaceinigrum]KAB8059627.1 hypothetical protein GCN75_26080 [Janthinobacterium violaceinigrum]